MFVRAEYAATQCCQAGKNIFRVFDLTPFDDVKVVILGQDPYHTPGAAMIASVGHRPHSRKSTHGR